MQHFTSFFLNSKSNVVVKIALFLLNAASAIEILHLISQSSVEKGTVKCLWMKEKEVTVVCLRHPKGLQHSI